jgi:hypothetical protein
MSRTAPIRVVPTLLAGILGAMLLVAGPSGIASATKAPPPANCGNADGSHFAGAVNGGKTGTGTAHGEIAGTTCYKRSGNKGTVSFSWAAVGHLYDGIFYYQLVNCKTGKVSASMSRTMQYPTGTKTARSGSAKATFALQAGVKYRPRVTGQGEYDRKAAVSTGQGLIGYFARGAKPYFIGDGYCQ